MNRRIALKNLGLITSGIFLLPACEFSDEKASIALNKLNITASQEQFLKEVVSTIIPEGDIPGAKTLKVDNFIWIMIDDCANSEKQNEFIKGLDLCDTRIDEIMSKSFLKLNNEEKFEVLTKLFKSDSENGTLKAFLNTTKNYTIWGYKQSEYYMTELMPYSLVPGTFGLCETIDNSKKINHNA